MKLKELPTARLISATDFRFTAPKQTEQTVKSVSVLRHPATGRQIPELNGRARKAYV